MGEGEQEVMEQEAWVRREEGGKVKGDKEEVGRWGHQREEPEEEECKCWSR